MFKTHWRILLGCFIGLSVCAAPAYTAIFGLFLQPMAASTGWTRGQISTGTAVTGLVMALLLPIMGRANDRWGGRRLVLAGCILMPLAMASYSLLSSSYSAFLLVAVLAGVTTSLVSPTPYIYVLSQYIDRNLGLAISLALVGLGLGAACMPLLAQLAIGEWGWRVAWLVLAAGVGIVGVANCLAFFKDHPGHRSRGGAKQGAEIFVGNSFGEVMRTFVFWELCLAFTLVAMVTAGLPLHLPALAVDRGYSGQTAATTIALVGLGSLVSRLLTGVLLDRWPPVVASTLFFGGQALGLLLMLGGSSDVSLLIAAILVGGAAGSEADMMPFVMRRAFGLRSFGQVYGLCFALFIIGGTVGRLLLGLVFDAVKSYDDVLIGFVVATVLAMIVMADASARLGRRKRGAAVRQMPTGAVA